MRADPARWPYNDPGNDDPDWTAGVGQTGWTAGDDSWPGGATGPNWTAGDDSWTGGGGASPGWPYGEDHPSYPASNDPPGSPGYGGATPGWPYGENHPSYPASNDPPGSPGYGGPGAPGREPAPARDRNGRQAAGPAPARAAQTRIQAGGGLNEMHGAGRAQQWPGQQAADAAAYYDAAAGDSRVQVLPPANQDWQASAGVGTGEMPTITANGPAELLDPVRQNGEGFRSEDSVRLAERILSDADTQAAGIRQEALEHANAIREAAEREADEVRRQASYQADAAREAERQAEDLKRKAAEQAEAIREAAAREAD